MRKLYFFFFTAAAMLITSVLFSILITRELTKYQEKKMEIATSMSFKERITNIYEYIPIIGSADKKKEHHKELQSKADYYYNFAMVNTYILVLVMFFFIIANLLYYKNHEEYLRVYGLIFVICSLSFLYLGLNAPLIEVEAFNRDLKIDLSFTTYEYEGQVYYLYLNKSILKLIGTLFLGGNFIVAIILFLFSIVFPVIKLFSTLLVFLTPSSKYSGVFIKLINAIGKWSMADVFVAAIFLAIFSFANMDFAVETGSRTLLGLHYFMAFAVLSIFSGVFLKKYVFYRKQK